jgi:hypothetical protein
MMDEEDRCQSRPTKEALLPQQPKEHSNFLQNSYKNFSPKSGNLTYVKFAWSLNGVMMQKIIILYFRHLTGGNFQLSHPN